MRCGGHQYSGASSTSGDNIQLDLSYIFKDFTYDRDQNLLYAGVSLSLKEMNDHLRERGLFLPHGQCLHVFLGGHMQTGEFCLLSILCSSCNFLAFNRRGL